jgi:pimeloyl-ACP methyl ester carboxylesterase
MQTTARLDRGDGIALAWSLLPGRAPTVVFLPGFASDMQGAKATALAQVCAGRGQAMLRFDYSGHGASDGAFADGTIGRWLADALCVIDRVTEGQLLLVGSSMGGWIGLHVALARPGRVAALVGIAAAPDFTETMGQSMTPDERARLMEHGFIDVPSMYGQPLRITRALIEDGRRQALLGGPIALQIPVRLLQGQRDDDVPWETALRLAERIAGADVQVTLVKDGDHRLSRPEDLALLARTVVALLGEDGA